MVMKIVCGNRLMIFVENYTNFELQMAADVVPFHKNPVYNVQFGEIYGT